MLSLASAVLPRMLNPSVAAHHNDSCQLHIMHQAHHFRTWHGRSHTIATGDIVGRADHADPAHSKRLGFLHQYSKREGQVLSNLEVHRIWRKQLNVWRAALVVDIPTAGQLACSN